jgi:hypothetical protein
VVHLVRDTRAKQGIRSGESRERPGHLDHLRTTAATKTAPNRGKTASDNSMVLFHGPGPGPVEDGSTNKVVEHSRTI